MNCKYFLSLLPAGSNRALCHTADDPFGAAPDTLHSRIRVSPDQRLCPGETDRLIGGDDFPLPLVSVTETRLTYVRTERNPAYPDRTRMSRP